MVCALDPSLGLATPLLPSVEFSPFLYHSPGVNFFFLSEKICGFGSRHMVYTLQVNAHCSVYSQATFLVFRKHFPLKVWFWSVGDVCLPCYLFCSYSWLWLLYVLIPWLCLITPRWLLGLCSLWYLKFCPMTLPRSCKNYYCDFFGGLTVASAVH